MSWRMRVLITSVCIGIGLVVGGLGKGTYHTASLSIVMAKADETNQAQGTDGTCQWYLTQAGVLHIGEGTLAEPSSGTMDTDWSQIGAEIEKALPDGAATPTDAQATSAAELVQQVVLDGKVQAPVNSSHLFAQLANVTSFSNLTDLDTSHVTNMSYMFGNDLYNTGTDSLNELDVSNFDTSKVTNMIWMFGGLALTHIDLSSFNTTKVTDMMSMFNLDSNLESVNLSHFSMASLANGNGTFFMFYRNHSLAEITLGPQVSFTENPFLGVYGYESGNLPTASETYTGKWEAVGTGSVRNPLGQKFDTGSAIVNLYNSNDTNKPTTAETYVWEPVVRQTRVTAKYVDEQGKQLAPDEETAYGTIGSQTPGYTTKQISISGYTFAKVTGTPSGAYPETDATVTYTYRKQSGTAATSDGVVGQSTVIVRDVDESGNLLVPEKTLTGNVGEAYQTTPTEVKGYTLTKSPGNSDGHFMTTTQIVTYTYHHSRAAKVLKVVPVISAIRKIGLYRTMSFTRQNRITWYHKRSRTQWPMFVITGEQVSKKGVLRYRVRDVNHGSKTFGKRGYVTANKKYVVATYYQKKPSCVKVICPDGIKAYTKKSLTGRKKRLKYGTTVAVSKVITYHRTTRFQLANGRYISANKKFVKVSH